MISKTINLLTEMYDHQQKAVEKLSKIKVGALYMEMGTGKTRTALELIKQRLEAGKVNHVLWLCPCSVKENLRRDIIKHLGSFDKALFTICGIETLSSSISANVRLRKLVRERKCFIIVDESNLVKNIRAKRTQNILGLADKCEYRLILNGTPVSKNEADMFAQWQILDWRILGYRSFWSFARNHVVWDENIRGKIRRIKNVEYLTRKIAPYTYQIRKDECLDLPKKSYETVYYDMSDTQWEHYNEIADDLLLSVDEFKPYTIYRLFTGLQNVISGLRVDTSSKHLKSKPFFNNLLNNPRMQKLLETVEQIDGHKIIIFCKYTHEINDVVNVLESVYGEGSALPFNGEINQKQRQKNLDKFAYASRFLVANKTTAGYGLNLQFCNYVIYYTNDWDYATRSQSEDRVHRIRQNKNVHIIDICAEGTLDERILTCLSRKEGLVDSFKDMIDKMKGKKDVKALTNWVKGGR